MEKNCIVCGDPQPKYKCPSCYVPYCSASCCKTHKDSPECSIKQQQTLAEKWVRSQKMEAVERGASSRRGNDNRSQFDENSLEKLNPEQLALLDDSDELKSLLQSGELRKMLTQIAKADTRQADREIRHQMDRNPLFLKFVDTCLEVVQPKHLADVVTKFSKS